MKGLPARDCREILLPSSRFRSLCEFGRMEVDALPLMHSLLTRTLVCDMLFESALSEDL